EEGAALHHDIGADDGVLTDLGTGAPPVLPESRTFQQALDLARALADRGATDQSWAVLEAALPHWHCDSPHRIAPVVLLTDPAFREVVTPARARRVVTTPRGEFRE
ncbi:hypothetical protein ACWEWX_30475, partial [Streptomyces asiaticus]